LIDNVVRALAIALVPLLHVVGALAPWHLYGLAILFGLLMMIPLAGTPTLIPALVPVERRQTANALEMLGFTAGGVAGPSIGGVLIATVGAPLAVLLSVASYLLFAWSLAGIPPQPPGRAADRRAPLGEAVRLLLGNGFLLATTLMFLVFNIGLGLFLVWLPVFTETRLGGGATGYGLMLTAFAAGEMAAAAMIGALPPGGRLGLRICIVQCVAGLAALALWPVVSGALAAGVLTLLGLMVAPMTVWTQTLRMAIVPPATRGRTFALLRTLMQAGRPIGGVIAGLVLAPDTLGPAILLSAALIGLPGLAGLGVRELRRVCAAS
jgi:MFS family permease